MRKYLLVTLLINITFASQGYAAQWSNTELQLSQGKLKTPSFVADATHNSARTNILTFQHASGWQYGDNFFFVDYLNDDNEDSFNNADFYAELYLNFSLSKMTKKSVSFGRVKDLGLLLGGNFAADAKVRKYLPGVRLSWDLPGFAFINTDFMAYIDDSKGVAGGGAPAESDANMLDINWAYPLSIGNQAFSIEGHMEYLTQRENEFGQDQKPWVLAQPQFRWDAGKAFFGQADQLFLGIEYQYWRNKLGDADTDESAVQLLLVWRL